MKRNGNAHIATNTGLLVRSVRMSIAHRSIKILIKMYLYICPRCGNKYKLFYPNQPVFCTFCNVMFQQAGIYYEN